jgi:M6 family metalloprotease-like protein
MQALARYYATVSEGQLLLEADVFPLADTLAYTLPTSMLRYGNGRTPEEIGQRWRDLAGDAFAAAAADPQGPDFAEYDSYLIIHAGLGHETGELNDIRSVYLSAQDLAETGGPIAVPGALVENLWILPEAVDFRGRAGMNGLLAKFFGHQMGLPGLSNFADGLPGLGGWSLMDIGANRIGFVLHADSLEYVFGTVPPHPMAWTKTQLGWIEPTTVWHDTTLTLLAGDRSPAAGEAVERALRIPLSPTEALWLENRQQRGRTEFDLPAGVSIPFEDLQFAWIEPSEASFTDTITAAESDSLAGRPAGVWLGAQEYDAFVPGSGVLAWHVDDAVIDSATAGFNNNRQRPGIALKEADGYRDIGNRYFDRQDLTEGTRTDPFFAGPALDGSDGVDSLGSDTTPTTRTNTGLDAGVSIRVLDPPGDRMRVRIRFERQASGWPARLEGVDALQAADLDGNGIAELLASTGEWTRHLAGDGSLVASFRGALLAASPERVVTADADTLRGFAAAGSEAPWRVVAPGRRQRGLLAVLDGTGDAVVTAGDQGMSVRAAATGEALWDEDLPVYGLAAADRDADGRAELISVGPQGVTTWEGSAPDRVDLPGDWWAPAAGDLDGDGDADVLLVDARGRVAAVGAPMATVTLPEAPTGPPVLADVDADGRLDIVVLTAGAVHVLTPTGLRAPGYPWSPPVHHEAGDFLGEPVAGDLNGDGSHDIVAASRVGLYAVGADGRGLAGFPAVSPVEPTGAPLVTDVDGDGLADVAAPTTAGVHVWRPAAWAPTWTGTGAGTWGQSGGGADGRRSLTLGAAGPAPTTGDLLTTAYCYPNPVDPAEGGATVRFRLAREARVELTVYDAIGTRLTHIADAPVTAGAENEITWPVDDYASGLYLCRLTARGNDGSRSEATLRMAVRR